MHMESENWLNEEVYVGALETCRRRAVIWRFAKYGIIPFLKSHGYTLDGDMPKLSCDVASLLFHNRGCRLVCPYEYGVNAQNDYSIEHKQHYNHVIDYTAWEKFWEEWSMWEDVSLDSSHGFYRRIDIQDYIWSEIQLATSPQTRIVEEHIEGYRNEDGYRDEPEEF